MQNIDKCKIDVMLSYNACFTLKDDLTYLQSVYIFHERKMTFLDLELYT